MIAKAKAKTETVVKGNVKDDTKKQTRTYVSATDFVRAYKVGETWEDVARLLGQTVTTVQQRAYNFRKKGVNIVNKPALPGRGAKKLDIAALNAILAE